MAKGNLFLGFASGKIGSVVMYRSKGAQVSRALNPSPSNPQSALQMLQRVCLKTSSSAYSLLQDITNHAFEGLAPGTDSQGAFVTRNVQQMRTQLADYINSGDAEEILSCVEANFNNKADTWPAMRPYIVSQGRAPQVPFKFVQTSGENTASLALDITFPSTPTYDQLITALGLQRGDQLTFLFLSVDDTDVSYTYNGFHYARVILEPANGVFSTPFITNGAITSPNPRNKGALSVDQTSAEGDRMIAFNAVDGSNEIISPDNQATNSLGAAAIIVSRLTGETWQRSNTQLIVRSSLKTVPGHLAWDHETGYLAEAIASYLKAGAVSTEYLNQAQKVTATNK